MSVSDRYARLLSSIQLATTAVHDGIANVSRASLELSADLSFKMLSRNADYEGASGQLSHVSNRRLSHP